MQFKVHCLRKVISSYRYVMYLWATAKLIGPKAHHSKSQSTYEESLMTVLDGCTVIWRTNHLLSSLPLILSNMYLSSVYYTHFLWRSLGPFSLECMFIFTFCTWLPYAHTKLFLSACSKYFVGDPGTRAQYSVSFCEGC